MATKYAAFGAVLEEGSAPLVGQTSKTISAATAAASVATFTTSTNHGYSVGDYVRVSGVTPSAYNGDWEVSQLVGLNGFKAKIKSTPAAGTVFGAVIRTDIFAEVAGLGDLTGISVEPNLTDATTHDSPGGFEEQVATTIATGEASFWLAFDPADASQMAIQADGAARVQRNWKITPRSAGNKRYRFAGVVSGFTPKAPIKGLLTADVKFTVSGEPDELPAA